MVHRFRLSDVVLHAENRYTLLCKCCTALIFVVLSGVIRLYVCSTLYGSYGGLTLYLANSPCSSVAWLLGGVRRVIRPSEHLLTDAWRHCLRATVRLWSVTDLVLSWFLFLLIFSTNLWFMINSGSAFQRYYTLDSITLKRYSLTLSCIVLYAMLPVL